MNHEGGISLLMLNLVPVLLRQFIQNRELLPNGDGNGLEAKSLTNLPEDISAVKTTHPYHRQIPVDDAPGSSMFCFTFFDRDKLDNLLIGPK
jgi:hypothetical protein